MTDLSLGNSNRLNGRDMVEAAINAEGAARDGNRKPDNEASSYNAVRARLGQR